MKKKNKKRAPALRNIFRFNVSFALAVVLLLVLFLGGFVYPGFLKTRGAPITITNTFSGGVDDSEGVVNVLERSTWNKYLDSEAIKLDPEEAKIQLAETISEWEGLGFNVSNDEGWVDENPMIYSDLTSVTNPTRYVFIVWERRSIDGGGDYSILVKKVDTDSGLPAPSWELPVVVDSGNSVPQNPVAVSNGNGGIIIVWEDSNPSHSDTGVDIHINEINSDGASVLGEVVVVSANDPQLRPNIVGDFNEGAFVSWYDMGASRNLIQKFSAPSCSGLCWDDGSFTYPGITIVDRFVSGDGVSMVSNIWGDVIVVWADNGHTSSQSPNPNRFKIYAQKITASGDFLWSSSGMRVSYLSSGVIEEFPRIAASNDDSEVFVFWKSNEKIYVQSINRIGGEPIWHSDVVVTDHPPLASYSDLYNNYKAVYDSSLNAAVIVWQEYNGTDNDVYAQKIDSSGNAIWTAGGIALGATVGDQDRSVVNFDPISGNFYFTWNDDRSGTKKVYAQKVSSAGLIQYGENGMELNFERESSESSPYVSYVNFVGKAIVVYADDDVPPYDVYMQRIGEKNFFTEGIIVSSVFDFGRKVNWGDITVDVDLPDKIFLETRTSQDNIIWSSWSDQKGFPTTRTLSVLSPSARYIQYRLTLARGSTPKLGSVSLSGISPSLSSPPSYSSLGQDYKTEDGTSESSLPVFPVVSIDETQEYPPEKSWGCKPASLPVIQATPIPPFDPTWGTTYAPWFDRVKWALDHRGNIYYEYVNLLKREPCPEEVNWWLRKEPNIFIIRYSILISEEYKNKQNKNNKN